MPLRLELLTIGDELLDGRVVDSNSTLIANALAPLGLVPAQRLTLPDDREALVTAFRAISARAHICIVSGGLGPTDDDLTVDALLEAAGVGSSFDERAWGTILKIYGARTPPEMNRKQARRPDGGRLLYTLVGTAPGVELQVGGCTFILLPGVPREVRWHLEQHVLPILRTHATERPELTLNFALMGESDITAKVDALGVTEGMERAWRSRGAVIQLRLRGEAAALEEAAGAIEAAFPRRCFARGLQASLEGTVLELAKARGASIGTAESCTGGLVAAALTSVPGSSAVVAGGIVSYSNEVKQARLGVPEATLKAHGAVSEECALAMAEGARQALGCDLAVSITGIAGPGGGVPGKPVGTVCFAWATPEGSKARTHRFRGDRDRVRAFSVARALDGLRLGLQGDRP